MIKWPFSSALHRATLAQIQIHPLRLFFYAQAFRFSSGRGQCFSPGFKALCVWQWHYWRQRILSRSTARWWRVWLERV